MMPTHWQQFYRYFISNIFPIILDLICQCQHGDIKYIVHVEDFIKCKKKMLMETCWHNIIQQVHVEHFINDIKNIIADGDISTRINQWNIENMIVNLCGWILDLYLQIMSTHIHSMHCLIMTVNLIRIFSIFNELLSMDT